MLSFNFILLGLSLATSTIAAPTSYRFRREVPQEHSHEAILIDIRKQLALDNPQNLGDPVFALLGAAAAKQGLGDSTDPDCLQQAIADQSFTNAKAANDVAGMTSALIFRALERNSGSVGAASPDCTSVTATNPEIAALSQHQDPAGDGAQAANKAIVLELAKQIASVGGTATDALKSGTFAPGTKGDPTAKGNTCDDANDTAGCIVSQNLLVEDATEAEITAAVAGVDSTGSGSDTSTSTDDGSSTDASSTCAGTATVTVTAASESTAAAATTAAAAAATTSAATSTAAAGDIGDFGSCTVPQIEFGSGFDNRKETSFQPVDQTSYAHTSAQNVDIIMQFMCDTLTNSCKADDTAKATCKTATAAADAASKGTGAQADAFNAAFGITTNFASLAVISNTGVTVTPGADPAATPAAASATAAAAAATTTAAAVETAAATTSAAAAAATTAASSSGAASGANLQAFTGSLGDVTAPAVTDTGAGAQPFSVEGNATFSSLQNALVRSCDVQHNKCANAANSSGNKGDVTVTACGDQQTQCNAQAQTTAASARR